MHTCKPHLAPHNKAYKGIIYDHAFLLLSDTQEVMRLTTGMMSSMLVMSSDIRRLSAAGNSPEQIDWLSSERKASQHELTVHLYL